MRYKNLIKAIVFALVFTILFSYVTQVLTVSDSDMEYQWMSGIYEEDDNSLDAVYIGSSNCYAFWNQNIAWQEYGIAVYPYVCSAQPLLVAEYLIKEARKTQPDALYIVNVNTPGDGTVSDIVMHRLLDFMPLSKNKLQLTNYLCSLNNLSFSDRLEYYLPIIKYHEKWSELTADNFSTEINDIKGGDTYSWYFSSITDLSEKYVTSDEYLEISDALNESLNSLLDYCDEENVNILFVTVPRAEELENLQKINTVNKIISERGYSTLNLNEAVDELNLDLSVDYYNDLHTNIHGSIKFTDYFANYLIENYNFKDKREDEAYTSWNESCEKYADLITPYVLDWELDIEHRDYSLSAPENLEVSSELVPETISVSWEKVNNADGYIIYKKTGKGAWTEIAVTSDLYYSDTDFKEDTSYSYTVVPFKTENGEKMYGNYKYNGVKVKT